MENCAYLRKNPGYAPVVGVQHGKLLHSGPLISNSLFGRRECESGTNTGLHQASSLHG